jgi:hypothetical protein
MTDTIRTIATGTKPFPVNYAIYNGTHANWTKKIRSIICLQIWHYDLISKKLHKKNKAKLRIHIRFTGRESDEQKAKKYRRWIKRTDGAKHTWCADEVVDSHAPLHLHPSCLPWNKMVVDSPRNRTTPGPPCWVTRIPPPPLADTGGVASTKPRRR